MTFFPSTQTKGFLLSSLFKFHGNKSSRDASVLTRMNVAHHHLDLLEGPEIHSDVLAPLGSRARRSIWMATANLKDLHLDAGTGFRPFMDVLLGLAERGVEVRIIHSSTPSMKLSARMESVDHPRLQLRCCPRNHIKCVILDGYEAYLGSANLTGAGMGAKSEHRRNFELGIRTRDSELVRRTRRIFETIWEGGPCPSCAFQHNCPRYNREQVS